MGLGADRPGRQVAAGLPRARARARHRPAPAARHRAQREPLTRLAIISDTHLPRGTRRLPVERLRDADLILHAGDFAALSVLEELEALGPPVAAVHGNVDGPDVRARVPERRVVEAGGTRIGMVHDAGPATGRLVRLRAAFPDCAAVVFGHSHIPLLEDDGAGFQIFNPGSPTDRRRQPRHTMGVAEAAGGEIRFELVELD